MTSTTLIIITTGRDRLDRLTAKEGRLVELRDISDFPECTLQVLEMQGGSGITNVYARICSRRVRKQSAARPAEQSKPKWLDLKADSLAASRRG